MPATSIFIKAASSGISGMGNSRISVLLGPVRTAASTFSTTKNPPIVVHASAAFHLQHSPLYMSNARECANAASPQTGPRATCAPRPSEAMDARAFPACARCPLPGCLPIETVVAFWTDGDKRHQFKLFKRVVDVVAD